MTHIPEKRLVGDFECVHYGELHSDGGPACPVCNACWMPVWGKLGGMRTEGLQVIYSRSILMVTECYNCHLLEGHFAKPKKTRIGWVWCSEEKPAVLAEAQRMYADKNEHAIRPTDDTDRTHWLVYADWLDENGYPLNAAAVRQKWMT